VSGLAGNKDDLLRDFLSATLASWKVAAVVERGSDPCVASIHAADGIALSIERAADAAPFRWVLRSRVPGAPSSVAEVPRSRPCASVAGLLNALRGIFGIVRGAPVRVAPAARTNRSVVRSTPAGPEHHAGLARDDREERRSIPVYVLTGFLGSGKTTLLARLLRDPAMSRTAVIINEFGEIGLDHELIETSDESFVTLSNGCLCCKVRSDLARTLDDLAARRAAGQVSRFERVVIETSGLADPAPILHALMTDPAVREAYAIGPVITTVDAMTGLSSLERFPESLKQVALADRIVLTKTDLPDAEIRAAEARILELNPRARVLRGVRGEVPWQALFSVSSDTVDEKPAATNSDTGRLLPHDHSHSSGITTFTLLRERPLHAATLTLFLSALAENCGSDLLRVKGIVGIAEEPERPAVIHGVQHVYYTPEWLERWPSGDRRTRVVFIGSNIDPAWSRQLLELLEGEVAEELRARARTTAAAK
jgi:G3E family GTPase